MFAEVVRWNVGQMKWGQIAPKNCHEVLNQFLYLSDHAKVVGPLVLKAVIWR